MLEVAVDEAQTLLRALAAATGDASLPGLTSAVECRIDDRPDLERWQARLVGAGAVLAELSARVGRAVEIDAVEVVNQRADLRGLKPRGTVSAGGGCRLLPARDGWVAVSLNRSSDWELLPALFGTDRTRWDWDAVAVAVTDQAASDLESAAALLGLAVAAVPAEPPVVDQPWRITMAATRAAGRGLLGRVVDLSALWAGPLCASLLRRAGGNVLTVESAGRPDGARRGDPELHRQLHAGNTFALLDFADPAGRAELHRLVDEADVVISAARIRALRQLGLDPFTLVERRPGLTWVGISAYGLTGPWSNRVGYGDDAAIAGGLVTGGRTPRFVADAVADPITGIYAATAALAVAANGGGVIDIALRDAAAHVARRPS